MQTETIARRKKAQRTLMLATAGLILALVAVPLAWPTINTDTFSGAIQDSTCAATAVNLEKECSQACVRKGAKWVLFDPYTEEVYKLDDQQKASKFAVQHVEVSGKLEKSTKTIHVVKIKSI